MILVKGKNCLKRKWKLLLALTIFWVLLISIFNPFLERTGGERRYGYTSNTIITLKNGDEFKQDFLMPFDGLCEIKFNFQNIKEDESQQVLIQMWDKERNQKKVSKRILLSDIDNGEYQLQFPQIDNSKNGNYYIRIVNISNSNDVDIVLSAHLKQAEFEKQSYINNIQNDANLTFTAVFYDNGINVIYIVMWGLIVFLSYLCILLLKGDFKHDFLVIATSMGIGFLLLNPFPHIIDEPTHFFRSFCISQGDWHDTINKDGNIGAQVPENLGYILETEFSPLSWYANRELYNQPFEGKETFYVKAYMSSVIPLDHAVSAVGIAIGRLVHFPAAIVIYLSRIMDLLFYLVFGYLALRLLKYYRSIFFGILLLPACMFLAGSCTQDAVLISASLCFIARCLKLIMEDDKKKIKIVDIIPLIITIPFIASIKYLIYIPIFLLICLIPNKKFGKKKKLLLCFFIIIICLLSLVYQIYLLKAFPFTEDRNGHVVVSEQIKFVFSNLYFTYRNFGTYLFENAFSHIQNTSISGLVGISSFTGVWVVWGSVMAQDKYIWNNKKKKNIFIISISLISLVIFGLTMAALYVGFTPVGEWGIAGLQTRYIFPFLPLICIALAHLPIKNYMKDYEMKYAFIMIIANATAIVNRCL